MVTAAGVLRIAFFGTPEFAVPTLRKLLDSPHPVVGVVTQPDRARGRGQRISDSPVKAQFRVDGSAWKPLGSTGEFTWYADLPANVLAICFREAGITLLHFRRGVLDQEVQQIVDLDPQPFASRNLHEGFSSLVAVRGRLIAELARGGVRERDHLV